MMMDRRIMERILGKKKEGKEGQKQAFINYSSEMGNNWRNAWRKLCWEDNQYKMYF